MKMLWVPSKTRWWWCFQPIWKIRRKIENTIPYSAKGPWNKSLNFIFPTKYVIPKSLKVGHWLSHSQNKGMFKNHHVENYPKHKPNNQKHPFFLSGALKRNGRKIIRPPRLIASLFFHGDFSGDPRNATSSPPRNSRPYWGTINHWFPLIRPYYALISWGVNVAVPMIFGLPWNFVSIWISRRG